ncbi:hypothetical protein CWC05_11960 [Pseudoalteromonas ruthenica]|uniref:Sel1 repeat family protein n=1 Tax=Pseudoalteromonas ruthenica TaxID=151081 RepID=A0A5S3Z377_9GAMM|nr:hypothetical protein [Pseudoalteromonas ruthenica]TMP86724.1 hypothetical protein CWC05_11960 [Pseudoalteromonas ruthenica]
MIKAIAMLLALISSTLIAAGPSWDHSIKIDAPKLTVKEAAQQCHKSLINAPELLEAWCKKAYEMGYWSALVPISLHTGDGTRLVAEAKERLKNKEPGAYTTLAWLYGSGQFVKKDIAKAIALREELLVLDKSFTPNQIAANHMKLADLYIQERNWKKVAIHAEHVLKHTQSNFQKKYAKRQLESAERHLSSNEL